MDEAQLAGGVAFCRLVLQQERFYSVLRVSPSVFESSASHFSSYCLTVSYHKEISTDDYYDVARVNML